MLLGDQHAQSTLLDFVWICFNLTLYYTDTLYYILISLCILHAFIWISSVCKSIPLAPSVLNGFEGTSQMTSAAHFIHQMENLNGRYPSSPLEARYLAGPSNVCVNHYLQSTKPAGIDFLISSHRSMKSYRKKMANVMLLSTSISERFFTLLC